MKKPSIAPPRPASLSRRHFFGSVASGAAEAAILTLPAEAAQPAAAPAADTEMVPAVLHINGQTHSLRVEPRWTLQHVLHDRLGLTGTKSGCDRGECGACTVLLDGEPVNSCLIPACSAAGRKVETVESLGTPEKLSKLQTSFLECGGAQCGICTPGMLMTAHSHLKSGGKTDDASVRTALAGNLCRCTGYQDIVKSVIGAAKKAASKK